MVDVGTAIFVCAILIMLAAAVGVWLGSNWRLP